MAGGRGERPLPAFPMKLSRFPGENTKDIVSLGKRSGVTVKLM